jgi:predicted nuclease of predicted toxin-antitoxin system
LRYLLDEDVNPAVAQAARTLDLDVVSVHEIGRRGEAFPDDAQLRFAASEQRVLVTRNRDDFIRLTLRFFQAGEPHSGVLIIPHNLPNRHPGRIARALKRWHDARPARKSPEAYVIDFLGGTR